MTRKGHLLVLLLVILAGGLSFFFINHESKAQGLAISEEDYLNGTKRFAAVKKKVTAGLKQAFRDKDLKWGSPIFIRAFKEERQLELWVKKGKSFVLFDSYFIAGTSGGLGPKERQGDGQIPEGFYSVTPGQMNPQSDFHLSFNIRYPNKFDRAYQRTGDFIMVHGSNVSIGCLAMTNSKIEQIYTIADAAFKGGQKFFRVHLFPFRMTDAKMARRANHRWAPFWKEIRKGYQLFQKSKVPPNVTVKDKSYQFQARD